MFKDERMTHNNSTSDMALPIDAQHIKCGKILLARCRGQPFYISRILRVDSIRQRCYMRFEDDVTHWCRFRDIQRTDLVEGKVVCSLCYSDENSSQIISCSRCCLGFHVHCHNPVIENVDQNNHSWLCRLCEFETGEKARSMKTLQSSVLQKKLSKKVTGRPCLPYDLNVLTWDEKHQINQQNCYCYCGGPGDWSIGMLQCSKCKQWFHTVCIQRLAVLPLIGDRMFIFVCSICMLPNHEYLHRIRLKWVQIVQLALYSLSTDSNRSGFTLQNDIVPWITTQWNKISFGKIRFPEEGLESTIYSTLRKHTSRFKIDCSRDSLTSCWALHKLKPPSPPVIDLPDTSLTIKQMTREVAIRLKSLTRSNQKRASPLNNSSDAKKRPRINKATENHSGELLLGQQTNCVTRLPNSTDLNDCRANLAIGTSAVNGTNHVVENLSKTKTKIDNSSKKNKMTLTKLAGLNKSNGKVSSQAFSRNILHGKKNKKLTTFSTGLNRALAYKKLRQEKNSTSAPILVVPTEDISKSLKHPKNVVLAATIDTFAGKEISVSRLRSSIGAYFGSVSRLAQGESMRILARRRNLDGTVQYLVEWEGGFVV